MRDEYDFSKGVRGKYYMATIDSREVIDILIANNGWYPDDNIQVVKIVEYTNAWGNQAYGIVYSNEMDSIEVFYRYEIPSEYINNPKVIWRARNVSA